MSVLGELEPKNVFRYFEEICGIPHPSYKEKKISDYLVAFAKEHHLEYEQDALYNVIMIKEATPGYEDVEPIILQGHMDMVCEKKPDCAKNMEEEGLDLAVDNDYVYAKGTTLGGDDGIAVAYALAILDDDTLQHPRLEFVCTVCEEVGMEGASGIDVSRLKGKKLLNIDSEEEGYMLASCAGGCSAKITLPVSFEKAQGLIMELSVTGLTGGHSGTEIDKERGNANVVMSRILRDIGRIADLRLVSFDGGKKDNAIPRECRVKILVSSQQAKKVRTQLKSLAGRIKDELSVSDPNLQIEIAEEHEGEVSCLGSADSQNVIGLLQSLPNGIMRMSRDIPGLVETSLNLGIVSLGDTLVLCYAVRSSVGSAKEDLLSRLSCVAESRGASVEFSGNYPAWEYRKDSTLREDMIRIYEKMFGVKPVIQAIHAGLECGIFAGKIEGLDCVSMGPDILDIHTSEERLSISSTKRMYEYLLEVLRCK